MWAASEFQLGKRGLEVFDDFGGDDVRISFDRLAKCQKFRSDSISLMVAVVRACDG
jgi:hypothetical protein